VDIVVRRQDLEKIAKAAAPFGLQLRHVAGVDMLVQRGKPSARRVDYVRFCHQLLLRRLRLESLDPRRRRGK